MVDFRNKKILLNLRIIHFVSYFHIAISITYPRCHRESLLVAMRQYTTFKTMYPPVHKQHPWSLQTHSLCPWWTQTERTILLSAATKHPFVKLSKFRCCFHSTPMSPWVMTKHAESLNIVPPWCAVHTDEATSWKRAMFKRLHYACLHADSHPAGALS